MEKTTDLKASKVTVDEKNCQTPECHGTMEEMAAQTEGKAYLTTLTAIRQPSQL